MQAEAQDPRDYFDAGSLILALAAAFSAPAQVLPLGGNF